MMSRTNTKKKLFKIVHCLVCQEMGFTMVAQRTNIDTVSEFFSLAICSYHYCNTIIKLS